ncbi:Probable N-succinyldiaminopimelate aminotransferase DapC [Geodia barretti]|uniref:kynurenine--oxoglutarate transaminase n=1 Tax=Geodia barretti TaxID=519541 RepID=A0AA35SA50_GEOBA|nr:Probable N-succinyldiaminopimelate aminotransferase DapC [Geodia barretti]
MLAVVDPGEEVIVFEPFYENYGPDTILSGAVPRYVRLQEPDWTIDEDALRAAVTDRTRAIIVNSPQNPSGKVFSEQELSRIAALCIEHDLIAFTDEIYEFITYDGARHIPIATLPGMADRTVTISGLSKSYSVTGWRVGWTVASEELTAAIRKVHDFLTVGAAAPLQEAGAAALKLPESYYEELRKGYEERRDLLVSGLTEVGFRCFEPGGAYYVMTDISDFGFPDDVAFAQHLVKTVGVAAVPGSSFYADPAAGRQRLRFTFCKKDRETLVEAVERLRRLR